MLKFENDEVERKCYEMLGESGVDHVSFGMNTDITEKDLKLSAKILNLYLTLSRNIRLKHNNKIA